MNKKVLKVMIALVMVFLASLYVLKIFFPEQFIMSIQNERIVAIGTYIDNHIWLRKVIAIFTNFITYWFLICACCRKWVLNWKESLIVLGVIIITQFVYLYDVKLASTLSLISMILIPALLNAKAKDIATVFSVHCLAQTLSISIRQLPTLLTSVNFMTVFLMGIESYLWLLLFYLYFNFKKE